MSIGNKQTTQQRLGSKILLEAGTNELEVLVFHLNGFRYGVNGAKVREVVQPPPVRPVPNSHPALEGICKLRDDVIPIVSLRKYFGMPEETRQLVGEDASQAVVTVFNSQAIAVRVDKVDRIHRISWQNMRPLPDLFASERNQFTGMTVIEDEVILMIDFEKISEEINGRREHLIQSVQASHPRTLAGKHVLYAEDSRMIQAMTVDLLKAAGIDQLQVFNNGSEAWEWLEKNFSANPVDIIVTDVEMPLMDGLHLTARIRANAAMKDVPIVLLSSLINPENEKKGISVGASAQLVKKRIEELPQVMETVLH